MDFISDVSHRLVSRSVRNMNFPTANKRIRRRSRMLRTLADAFLIGGKVSAMLLLDAERRAEINVD